MTSYTEFFHLEKLSGLASLFYV